MSESYANPAGAEPAPPPGSGFVHLHVHSEYSVLDGAVRIVPITGTLPGAWHERCRHHRSRVLSSAVEFYREAIKRGIKPIIGFEAYVAPDRFEKSMDWNHLTLLAENNTGYQNLVRICSKGFSRGFLLQAARGQAGVAGAFGGHHRSYRLPQRPPLQMLKAGDKEAAIAEVRDLQDIFGSDNVYIGIRTRASTSRRPSIRW